MRYLPATLLAVLISLLPALVQGTEIEILAPTGDHLGLDIFGVTGLQESLKFTIDKDGLFLLTRAKSPAGESGQEQAKTFKAGETGGFRYFLPEKEEVNCHIEGKSTDSKISNIVFDIISPTIAAEDSASYAQPCNDQTQAGIKLLCDNDPVILCRKVEFSPPIEAAPRSGLEQLEGGTE